MHILAFSTEQIMRQYDILIEKLDRFIRRYYSNQLLKGSLIVSSVILFYALTLILSEYFLYLPSWLRITALIVFFLIGIVAAVVWIIKPVAGLLRLGRILTYEQAAVIIGKHFPEISDKLINILQLQQQASHAESLSLLEAGIDQKADQIKLVPIGKAIDFARNKKYLPYLLPLVLVIVAILIASPSVFTEASSRLLQPTRTFEKPAPFSFIVINEKEQLTHNAGFTLKVTTEGAVKPSQMAVLTGTEQLSMQQHADTFSYTFKNVDNDLRFRLQANGYTSREFVIAIVEKPQLKSFKVELEYPAYTQKAREQRNSFSDLNVPEGTIVRWALYTGHTSSADLRIGTGETIPFAAVSGMYAAQYRFVKDTSYTIILRNAAQNTSDSISHFVNVILDQYPVLQVEEMRDSITGTQIAITGTAGDDYGISRVLFHYAVLNDKHQVKSSKAIPMSITPALVSTFRHYVDVQQLNLQMGEQLSYYFEAWDNDAINGSKAVKSDVMTYSTLTNNSLDSAIQANNRQISSGLSNSAQQSKELQSDFKDLQSRMLNSDKSSWEQERNLRDLLEKQLQVQNQLQNVQKRLEEQQRNSDQKEYSEDVRDKQEDLKKQLDNVLNKELQEQMKKLQELLEKLKQQQNPSMNQMKELEDQNKLFNMDMERMQELMKQLEMQMKLEDMARKADELAQKQLDLKQETDKGKTDNAALEHKQKDLEKKLDDLLHKDMQEAKELNDQMQHKQDMQSTQELGKEAKEQMKNSSQSLQKQQNSRSSQSQQKAAENLQQMAQAMQQQASSMDIEQIEMDIKAVRQILSNLIRLSFEQEKTMNAVRQTSPASDAYLELMKTQNKLLSNSRMIRDSLFVLSKKLSKLSVTVNKETTALEKNMQLAVAGLADRKVNEALTRQQYVMTHTNNLALMLNEMLQNLMQMQSQASQQKPGSGSCNKPGGSNPKPGAGKQLSDIITKQQQLGNAMQQMKSGKSGQSGEGGQQEGKEGENGNKEGGKTGKSGSSQGDSGGENGENGNSEQLAKYAAQQAAIRRQLQQLNSLLNSQGMGNNSKELQELQRLMDKNETDLVNRRITAEFLMRQKEITTRLLQAEKSLREQEEDDKRSSTGGKDIVRAMPAELQQFLKRQNNLLDFYKTVPAELKPYYKKIVENYYKMIGN